MRINEGAIDKAIETFIKFAHKFYLEVAKEEAEYYLEEIDCYKLIFSQDKIVKDTLDHLNDYFNYNHMTIDSDLFDEFDYAFPDESEILQLVIQDDDREREYIADIIWEDINLKHVVIEAIESRIKKRCIFELKDDIEKAEKILKDYVKDTLSDIAYEIIRDDFGSDVCSSGDDKVIDYVYRELDRMTEKISSAISTDFPRNPDEDRLLEIKYGENYFHDLIGKFIKSMNLKSVVREVLAEYKDDNC